MKECPNCHSMIEDDCLFCVKCGEPFGKTQPEEAQMPPMGGDMPPQQPMGGNGMPPMGGNGMQQPIGGPGMPPIGGPGMPPQPPIGGVYGQVPPQPPISQPNPYDHTNEFEAQDISDNKVYAMLPYIMGTIGIIIALLARKDSKFLEFHLRQAMKIKVTEILLAIVSVVGILLVLPGIVASVMLVVINVIKLITFFQVCSGKAKEPSIIRGLSFLR